MKPTELRDFSPTEGADEAQLRPGRRSVVGVVCSIAVIAVIAVNLRPAIVAVGPLSDTIRTDTGMGSAAISLLTTVPLVCLGVFAIVAPRLARRRGYDRTAVIAMILVVIGASVRLMTPQWSLFLGTVLAGAGIAIANVVVPALIKRDHPHRLGVMMATYSLSLQSGATLAAGVTVPLGDGLGLSWRAALALWTIPAAVAVVVWMPRAVRRGPSHEKGAVRHRVWRSPLGWQSALYMGMQSGIFYSITAWMPSLLTDAGTSTETAGLMLSIVGLAGIAGGVIIPIVAARIPDQRPLVLPVAMCLMGGVLGLLMAPTTLTVVWAVLLGLGQGAALALGLTAFTLRARTADGAAALSGTGQAGGYLIASTGPLLIGVAHDLTNSWTTPLTILLALGVPLVAFGWRIGADRYIEDETEPTRHDDTTKD